MATMTNRLSAKAAEKLNKSGLHADGGGLYLQIAPSGARSWVFRYKVAGAVRTMGLGPFPTISLAEARSKADECRRLRADGKDPLELRREAERQRQAETAKAKTFKECAEAFIALHEPTWKNAKHKQQWRNTLDAYVYPEFGSTPVSEVETADVTKVLNPLWNEKPETAGRVRGRIESVLSWAKAQGFRSGENPAAWRGHLDHVLPKKSKVRAVRHHAAMAYKDVPAFLVELRKQTALSVIAFELLILTAARTSEVLQATWGEIDLDGKIWTIPAERMKASKSHCIPLSERAVEVLKAGLPHRREGEAWVFPGERRQRPLSNMCFLMLLRRMKRTDLTAHGFRSTFRDWAAEETHYPNHVVEMALAHAIPSGVEAAYRRGDLFDKRRALMDDWSKYCAGKSEPANAQSAEEEQAIERV